MLETIGYHVERFLFLRSSVPHLSGFRNTDEEVKFGDVQELLGDPTMQNFRYIVDRGSVETYWPTSLNRVHLAEKRSRIHEGRGTTSFLTCTGNPYNNDEVLGTLHGRHQARPYLTFDRDPKKVWHQLDFVTVDPGRNSNQPVPRDFPRGVATWTTRIT